MLGAAASRGDFISLRARGPKPADGSGGEQHSQRGGVGVDLGIDADLADQLRHGALHIGLHPGGAMVEAEIRQAGQEDAA